MSFKMVTNVGSGVPVAGVGTLSTGEGPRHCDMNDSVAQICMKAQGTQIRKRSLALFPCPEIFLSSDQKGLADNCGVSQSPDSGEEGETRDVRRITLQSVVWMITGRNFALQICGLNVHSSRNNVTGAVKDLLFSLLASGLKRYKQAWNRKFPMWRTHVHWCRSQVNNSHQALFEQTACS